MMTTSAYGRLGRDPEVRETRNGNQMVTASLAVDVTPFNHDGEPIKIWISIAAFGPTGEALARHRKGDLIAVMGRLTLRPWTDREGNARETWQMTADALHSSRSVRPGGRRKRDDAAAAETADGGGEFEDDDLLF